MEPAEPTVLLAAEIVHLAAPDRTPAAAGQKDSPVNGTSAPVFRLMSDS